MVRFPTTSAFAEYQQEQITKSITALNEAFGAEVLRPWGHVDGRTVFPCRTMDGLEDGRTMLLDIDGIAGEVMSESMRPTGTVWERKEQLT